MTFSKFWLLPLALSLLVVSSGSSRAGETVPPWKVGFARVVITPDEPVRMSGYASRRKPSEGVAHDLYAKAIAFQDTTGKQGLLITTDLIGFRAAVAEAVCASICETTGLDRAQILLNSSHTHTGPTLSLDAESLSFPPEQAEATVRYTKKLKEKLVVLAESVLADLQPAKLSRGVGLARFVMNRREFVDGDVRLGFNPRGHVDRSVPVLRIDRPDGSLRGVLFGAACHNTTLGGDSYDISGDFAGYAQSVIEKEHPAAVALFMQGCAGDANPYPRGTEAIARRHGDELGNEVLRVLGEDLIPVEGPLTTLLEPVRLPLQAKLSREEIEAIAEGRGGWRGFVTGQMLKALEEDGALPAFYETPVAVWQFGDDLTLVALPGEVVVDFVRLIEDAIGPRRLWLAAYSNDVFGYIPSARVLEQGGYETRGLYSGSVGLFRPAAESALVEKVRDLAQQAGRKTAAATD